MVEERKKTKLEEFEEQIRIFKKNEEAIYDMLALYQFLVNEGDIHSLIGTTLAEKVIKDLEDPDVDTSYKDSTVKEFYDKTDIYPLLSKYRNVEECKELYDSFNESYKKSYCFDNMYRNLPWNEKFNLIVEIAKNSDFGSSEWAYEFLISDISLETRLEMFSDILSYGQFIKIKDFIKNEKTSRLNRTSKEKIEEKRQELLTVFNIEEASYVVRDFLNDLLKKRNFNMINSLQDSVFDFNGYLFAYNGYTEMHVDCVSTIGAILWYSDERNLDNFRKLYESDSYRNVSEEIRNNDDYVALHFLPLYQIIKLIKLPNFKLTHEKLDLIIKKFKDTCLVIDDSRKEEVIDAIIHKVKDEEDYEQILEYAKYFSENVDFEKEKLDKKLIKIKK